MNQTNNTIYYEVYIMSFKIIEEIESAEELCDYVESNCWNVDWFLNLEHSAQIDVCERFMIEKQDFELTQTSLNDEFRYMECSEREEDDEDEEEYWGDSVEDEDEDDYDELEEDEDYLDDDE